MRNSEVKFSKGIQFGGETIVEAQDNIYYPDSDESQKTAVEEDPEIKQGLANCVHICLENCKQIINAEEKLSTNKVWQLLKVLGEGLNNVVRAGSELALAKVVGEQQKDALLGLWQQRESLMKIFPYFWRLAKYGPLANRDTMSVEERELREFIANNTPISFPGSGNVADLLKQVEQTFLTEDKEQKPLTLRAHSLRGIAHRDAFRLYLGLNQRFDTFRPAKYLPTMRSGNKNIAKYEPHRLDVMLGLTDVRTRELVDPQTNDIDNKKTIDYLKSKGELPVTTADGTLSALGRFKLYYKADDGQGKSYVSGYDRQDYDPIGLTFFNMSPVDVFNRPYDIYFRLYEEDLDRVQELVERDNFDRYYLESILVSLVRAKAENTPEEFLTFFRVVANNEAVKKWYDLFLERFDLNAETAAMPAQKEHIFQQMQECFQQLYESCSADVEELDQTVARLQQLTGEAEMPPNESAVIIKELLRSRDENGRTLEVKERFIFHADQIFGDKNDVF